MAISNNQTVCTVEPEIRRNADYERAESVRVESLFIYHLTIDFDNRRQHYTGIKYRVKTM